MNVMRVQEIKRVGQSRLEYSYTIEGEWSKYFEPANPMWVEYSQPVDQVPDSIAVLPLIGNVIVLASLMDADIYVDEIDRDFYECIEEFIEGYDNIMPDHVHFKHRDIVHANKIVDTPLSQTAQEENLLFFSGGVDATFSLISHLEEKPALVTIWGADIPWDNEESWNQAIGFNQEVADRYGLNMLTVRSNFRFALNDDNVNEYSLALVNDWWWHAFHHSVAMMCMAAPFASGKRRNLYFGSTFSSKDEKNWGPYTIASDPQIDNHVRFSGCQVIHDGYAFSRHEKVQRICEHYSQRDEKPYLRVCFLSSTGKNCGCCAKCTRTIMDLLLAGGNPNDYGFQNWEEDFDVHFAAGLQETARSKMKYNFMSNFKYIQTAYRNKYTIEQVPPVLRVFYETELETLADFLHVPNNECITRDKVAREFQEQLFRQIGQLRYEMQTEKQSYEDNLKKVSQELAQMDASNEALNCEKIRLTDKKRTLEEQLQKIHQSTSWKVTKPLRFVGDMLRKIPKAKQKLKNKIYYAGLKVIRRTIPEGSWRHDYVKWRWWFICSDHYETRFKSMFKRMLEEYEGGNCSKGWLTRFDYWLCWIFWGAEPDDYFDFEFFRKGWLWRNHHVTRSRLNFLIPIFNEDENIHILIDKEKFYNHWNTFLKRKWCIPQNLTFEEFQSLFQGISRILVKPTSLYGGKGIYALDINSSNLESTYHQLHDSDRKIVVEEYVNQRGFLHEIYPISLNPLRVTTIRIGDKVEVLYAFFTVGCQGNIIANYCSGGIDFPVDTITGRMGVGQGRSSNGHRKHPDTGVEVDGQYVPDWQKIKEFACEAHRHAPDDLRLIGWDVCWNDGELSIIEGNDGPGFPELPDKHDNQWKMMKLYLDYMYQSK